MWHAVYRVTVNSMRAEQKKPKPEPVSKPFKPCRSCSHSLTDRDNVFISLTMAFMNNQKKTVYVGGLADDLKNQTRSWSRPARHRPGVLREASWFEPVFPPSSHPYSNCYVLWVYFKSCHCAIWFARRQTGFFYQVRQSRRLVNSVYFFYLWLRIFSADKHG